MKNSLISIITACYNSEPTIDDTIESVLNQTYTNIEYILIDGNSNDNTVNIIKSYEKGFKKKGIIYKWISERDNGIYDAINKGIDLANGELIGIIGSDDWYEKNAIEEIVKSYIKERPDYIHGNMNIYSKDRQLIKTVRPKSKNLMIKRMAFFHPSSFITKRVYDELKGYSLDYDICSDYDFILKIIKGDYTIKYIDQVIANFSVGGISTTSVNKALYESHLVRIQNGYSKWLSFYFYFQALLTSKIKKLLNEN